MTEKISISWVRAWAADQGLLPAPGSARTGSREVSLTVALDFVSPFLAACPTAPPVAFSPQWFDEPDEQLRFVAVLVAAVRWALQAEIDQDARVDAAHAVAQGIRDTATTPASSARYIAGTPTAPPFDYPPRRAA